MEELLLRAIDISLRSLWRYWKRNCSIHCCLSGYEHCIVLPPDRTLASTLRIDYLHHMAYRRIIVLLYIVSQLLLGFVPAYADGNGGCSVVSDDRGTAQCTSTDDIMILRARTNHAISPQVLFENWTSDSSTILHVRPLVRPDKVPDFFASSLRCTFLRHSVLLI
jgi:hypothetical protein